jgi:hypothetical protein
MDQTLQKSHSEILTPWSTRIALGLLLGLFSYFAHFRIPKFPASLPTHLLFILFYLSYSYYY